MNNSKFLMHQRGTFIPTLFGLILVTASGCNEKYVANTPVSVLPDPFKSVAQQAQFKLEIWSGDTKVFDDLNATSVSLEKSVVYQVKIVPTGGSLPESLKLDVFKTTGAGSSLVLTKSNFQPVLDGSGNTKEFVLDLALDAGTFNFRATASVANTPDTIKPYDLTVNCSSQAADKFRLVDSNANENSNISVTANGSLNTYDFNASAAATGGAGPYACAWDFNGDGIVDTDFGNCSRTKIYSNHVGNRKVGVFIRDRSCTGGDLAATRTVMLTPATNPDPFLKASISGTPDDPRLNLTHLSVNPYPNAQKIVCNYSESSQTFTLTGMNTYEKAPRKAHGLALTISGVKKVNSTTMDVSTAEISRINFATDEFADATGGQPAQPQIAFQGQGGVGKCHLLTKSATTKFEVGTPCTGGATNASLTTVEVQGTFDCGTYDIPQVSAPDDSIFLNINDGSFKCKYVRYDGCAGGGGGGGGIDPIKF